MKIIKIMSIIFISILCFEYNNTNILYAKEDTHEKYFFVNDDTVKTINETKTYSDNNKILSNSFSNEELDLLFRVVEAETLGSSIECKSNVASVIFNRINDLWWGGSLTKNLLAKRQFAVVTSGRYKTVTITEETIKACEIAYQSDTAQGALFFDSTKGKSWAHENKEYIFADTVHWFYK